MIVIIIIIIIIMTIAGLIRCELSRCSAAVRSVRAATDRRVRARQRMESDGFMLSEYIVA